MSLHLTQDEITIEPTNVPDFSPSYLIHPEIQPGHSFTSVLLIHSEVVNYNVFVDSVNSSTFPIVYSQYTTKTELTAFLQTHFLMYAKKNT